MFAALYGFGWWRIRQQSRRHRLATRWRLASYYGGLFSLALALLSPIDLLGGQLLIMHMVQHKILVMLAAPLLWLGNPFPIILWALPLPARRSFTTLLVRDSFFRRLLTAATQPIICWLLFVFTYIGWHDVGLYNLALRVPWVHDIEHITFFSTALLFWWPVVNGAPHLHKALPYWVRIIYLIAFVPPNAIAGFAIANSPDVIYTYYASVPRIWGFSAIEDQAWGGAIMWIWSSEMMIQAAIIMLGVSFYREKRQKTAQERNQQRKRGMLVGTIVAVALAAIFHPAGAEAHGGGTPQLSNVPAGPYHLFAWTSPEPWRVGSAHTTVAITKLLDDGQETPVSGVQVMVIYAPVGQPAQAVRATAVEQTGAKTGFYEADAVLPAAGEWQVAVEVSGIDGNGSVLFRVQVLPANSFNWWLIGGGVLVALVAIGVWGTRKRGAGTINGRPERGTAGSVL